MGVDAKLFTLMTTVGKDAIRDLGPEEMAELNVVNNGAERPLWTIESVPVGVYIKGQQETAWGMNKVMLVCQNRAVTLVGLFDERGRDGIAQMRAGAILIENKTIKIPAARTEGPDVTNGKVFVTFHLLPGEVQLLQRAKSVGVSMQFSYETPVFVGIYPIDFTGGREKLSGLLAACGIFSR
jgi:hypothetical protein